MLRIAARLLGAALALLVVAAVTVWLALTPPDPLEEDAIDFVLGEVTVINPALDRRQAVDLAVSGDTIREIGTLKTASKLDAYRGMYVLPGLIDLHTHLPPDNALQLIPHSAFLYLAHGVTSIRESGDLNGSSVAAARIGLENGAFPGPRLFACGPFVGGAPIRWKNTLVVATPQDAAQAVRKLKAAGFDCIKSYDELDLETMRGLLAEAESVGLPVVAHIPGGIAYEEALMPDTLHLLGVPPPDSIDPGDLLARTSDWRAVDEARMDTIVRATVDNGLAHTPTLILNHQLLLYETPAAVVDDPIVNLLPRFYSHVIWSPVEGIGLYRNLGAAQLARMREAFDKKLALVGKLHAAGAKLRLGTDVGQPFVVPGASLQQELGLFVRAGISPEDTWAIATRQAGEALGVPGLGTLKAGAPADLLVFRDDPTRDLAAMSSLAAVVAGGRLYDRASIDEQLDAYRNHFGSFVFERLSIALARRVLADLQSAAKKPEG